MRQATPGSRDHLPHGPLQTWPDTGHVTKANPPLPVLATLRWLDGFTLDVPATAIAWTHDAVQVIWDLPPNGLTREWIPAPGVRRGQTAADRINQASTADTSPS